MTEPITIAGPAGSGASSGRLAQLRPMLAEQLEPVAALCAALDRQWASRLPLDALRERARAGVAPYAVPEVLLAAGDLGSAFVAATSALESAGLASNEEGARARRRAADATSLAISWVAGDALLGIVPRTVGRRAAALVARSVLRVASAAIRDDVTVSPDRATCPCCDGAADIALRSADARVLVCARCDARWTTTARGCLGCGAVKAETLARLPSTHTGYTVIVCSACGRYLKERDADPAGTVDLLVERALTEELDRAAERRALRL